MKISDKIVELEGHGESRWAWANFLPTVQELITTSGARSIVEIGGGRFPSFSQDDVASLGVAYTSNDISARELSKAPAWVGKAEFDVQTPDVAKVAPFTGQFDLAFSKMVMEHVESYERAYRNIHRILAPGGISIAFHPVFYAMPFVVNRLIPETASQRILTRLFPNRTDDEIPKFPAYYSGCVSSRRVTDRLRAMGFSAVWQVPFYGHAYYNRLPVLRRMQESFAGFARRHDAKVLASYAYTVAVK